MNFLEEIINTECSIRKKQLEFGQALIICTAVVCLGICLLVLFSGGMLNEQTPPGTTAQILMSEQFTRLIIILAIPFSIGLTAGIILMKTSVRHITKSYCDSIVSIEKLFDTPEVMEQQDAPHA